MRKYLTHQQSIKSSLFAVNGRQTLFWHWINVCRNLWNESFFHLLSSSKKKKNNTGFGLGYLTYQRKRHTRTCPKTFCKWQMKRLVLELSTTIIIIIIIMMIMIIEFRNSLVGMSQKEQIPLEVDAATAHRYHPWRPDCFCPTPSVFCLLAFVF